MSKMDEQEFKFPDEIDNAEDQNQDEKFEIEIEDDTPEEDRGREPLPKEITEKLDKDELSQYDEDVKQKLLQMKKAWHDERRAKEAALREHEEAVAYAKRLMEDNKKVRGVLQTGEKQFAENLQRSADVELALAQREYKDAYESGDVDRITEATTKLQEASFKVNQAKNFRMPSLQEEEVPVTINTKPEQPSVPRPDTKALSWQQRNQWFGVDDEMTASALGLHQKLVRNGDVEIGSDEYYATLDKTMRKRFPEFFGGESSNNSEEVAEVQKPAKRAPTVVAPAVRSTASNKVKLTQRQVALAKKLGLTPEQYAIEMKRLEK
jgi:hypothetical protein